MECSKKRELDLMAAKIRKTALQTIQAAGSGHIGGSFSIADILSVLYFEKMNVDPMRPDDPDRDRLVLSKGHCSPAMYATLALKGFFLKEHLSTFRKLDSDLSGHVEIHVPGVDMSSGSLGQGLSVALGMAMYAKARKKRYRTFCILGDGEIQEGQVWEAAMCANKYKLDNLCAIVDYNHLQIDGNIEDVKGLNKISEKYPDNIEICKEILKKMENEKTQIEENAESDSTLYIALQDKIYLGNMHGSFTRIQTIAHECLHSIQDRKVLIFNFIFSNIYILYFIISSILIIIKKLPNELVFSNILLIISMLYYAIRMFLENDAMTKSEYLAKEYLKEKKILDEEEVKKIGKGLEELNKGAIIATNSSFFIKIMLKVAVFNLLALIF